MKAKHCLNRAVLAKPEQIYMRSGIIWRPWCLGRTAGEGFTKEETAPEMAQGKRGLGIMMRSIRKIIIMALIAAMAAGVNGSIALGEGEAADPAQVQEAVTASVQEEQSAPAVEAEPQAASAEAETVPEQGAAVPQLAAETEASQISEEEIIHKEEPLDESSAPQEQPSVEAAAEPEEEDTLKENVPQEEAISAEIPSEEAEAAEETVVKEAAKKAAARVTYGYLVVNERETLYGTRNVSDPVGRFERKTVVYAELVQEAETYCLVSVWFDWDETRGTEEPAEGFLFLKDLKWCTPEWCDPSSGLRDTMRLYRAGTHGRDGVLIPLVEGFTEILPEVPEEEPVVQEEEPAAQEEEPAVQEEEPAVQEEEPAVQEEEPASLEEEPASPEEASAEEAEPQDTALEAEPAETDNSVPDASEEETASEEGDPTEEEYVIREYAEQAITDIEEYDTPLGPGVPAEDTLNEENPRSVEVTYTWEGEGPAAYGGTVLFEAHLTGYEGLEYDLVWQHSEDGVTWEDIGDAGGETFRVVVTEENYEDYWRVEVFVNEEEG